MNSHPGALSRRYENRIIEAYGGFRPKEDQISATLVPSGNTHARCTGDSVVAVSLILNDVRKHEGVVVAFHVCRVEFRSDSPSVPGAWRTRSVPVPARRYQREREDRARAA